MTRLFLCAASLLLTVAACATDDGDDPGAEVSDRPLAAEWRLISIDRVQASTEDDTMTVIVSHARCGDLRVRVVEETPTTVVVRADQDVSGGCEDIGLTSSREVSLDAPLGERQIRLEQSGGGDGMCELDGLEARCGRPRAG